MFYGGIPFPYSTRDPETDNKVFIYTCPVCKETSEDNSLFITLTIEAKEITSGE